MVLGKLDNNMQKNEIGLLSYITNKINSKWTEDLTETIQLLGENTGEKAHLCQYWQ